MFRGGKERGALRKIERTSDLNMDKRCSIIKYISFLFILLAIIVGYSRGNELLEYQDGWPITLQGTVNTWIGIVSPVITDLDGDDAKELIVTIQGNPSRLVILNAGGQIIANKEVSYYADPQSFVSVADINNDGFKEIITEMKHITRHESTMLIFNYQGDLIHEWPALGVSDDLYGSVVVEDITKDGLFEIIYGGWCCCTPSCPTSETGSKLVILDSEGKPFDGFPVMLENLQMSSVNTPAVGNLDDDEGLEIVVISHENRSLVLLSNIRAFKLDGSILWSQQVNALVYNKPVIGDMNNDGYNEIAFTSEHGIYILDKLGNFILNLELGGDGEYCNSPVALADLDKDDDLEIVFGFNASMYAIHHDGSIIFMNSLQFCAQHPPIIGDINGDDILDIIMSDSPSYSKIYAWASDGNILPGFPITIPQIAFSSSIEDIDGDGDVELVTSSTGLRLVIHEGIIHVWDLDGTVYEGSTPWPMYQHDIRHTGCYGVVTPTTTPTTTTATNGVTTTTSSGSTTSTSVPSCLTEQIYGNSSKQTQLLRYFRDNILSKTPEGREIIKLYYQWSSVIVKAMESDEVFKEEVKEMIDGVLMLIPEEK